MCIQETVIIMFFFILHFSRPHTLISLISPRAESYWEINLFVFSGAYLHVTVHSDLIACSLTTAFFLLSVWGESRYWILPPQLLHQKADKTPALQTRAIRSCSNSSHFERTRLARARFKQLPCKDSCGLRRPARLGSEAEMQLQILLISPPGSIGRPGCDVTYA